MFDRLKQRRAQRAAERATQVQREHLEEAQRIDQQLSGMIQLARDAAAGTWPTVETSMPLHRGEHALLELDGAGLIEPHRGPGHWQGASQAISVHVPGTKSMRYRIGGTRGTFVQGDENPTLIDTGTLTITNQRAAFVGAKQTREWAWSKLVGFHDDQVAAWTGIAVSNRQKISGVSYPQGRAATVRLALELGVAITNDTVADLIHDLETERATLAAHDPGSAALSDPSADCRTDEQPPSDSSVT